MAALATLVTLPGRFLAEPLAQLLRSNGIIAFIHADDSGGVDPALGMVHGAQIRVPVSQLHEAREVLAAYEGADPPEED